MNKERVVAGATTALGVLVLWAGPASAGHDHFVVTPNGMCHQVAIGQTAINDVGHGGYHRYHEHVHLGATESTSAPDTLGDGNAQVSVYKDDCPAP